MAEGPNEKEMLVGHESQGRRWRLKPERRGEGTESSGPMNRPENPASANQLMGEVCERENLKAAL